MTFGEDIKKMRNKKGLSSRELARRAGVSQAYISQLETGKNNNPTNEMIKKIAKGLDMSYIELLQKAGYLEEAEKEEWIKSADEFRKYREKLGLEDIIKLNDGKINFDDIISALYLNTTLIYKGEEIELSREERSFLAEYLRLPLESDTPIGDGGTKVLEVIERLLK